MLEKLKNSKRILMEAELEPVQGDRFQPTGFPDIGAGTYQLPDGTRKILLESAQSMANRLENTIIDPGGELIEELKGLSYVKVDLEGESNAKTNSLMEAHRLNSPFIITDAKFQQTFKEEADYAKGKPIDWRKIAKTIFKYDVNSLLHGVFLANLEDGRIKIPRAITGFIEAIDAREVVYGGVKNNPIDPSGKIRAQEYDKDVYGNVPYQRMEYTASAIKVFFNFDLGMIRSYELGDNAEELLIALGLLKIRLFLEGGLRLRTACDLQLKNSDLTVSRPKDFVIPTSEELLKAIQEKIENCKEMFASPPVTKISTQTVSKETNQNTSG
ncbi:type I-G CRISPR-associated RAMP protein Csb1/Cas7g [Desulfohalobium retbaense]|uniref:CRISPR-associated protein n=1 Tax=Desulfohalobium retbaense (strain ATCC 49708 / DSM 5692 / JCM 16813 / HR100) TaxID=485915 RepID=C8X3B1_DESRD|nr:type I-U CRISPR-associated RAMP protein Csb1/Cas7u [Desulfohalobium retbaense]ACV68908.1 CRISPR-associated protein [Desulfohalobium retbaense DSM 5692]